MFKSRPEPELNLGQLLGVKLYRNTAISTLIKAKFGQTRTKPKTNTRTKGLQNLTRQKGIFADLLHYDPCAVS